MRNTPASVRGVRSAFLCCDACWGRSCPGHASISTMIAVSWFPARDALEPVD